MSEETFGELHAQVYDALYAEKDYDAECTVLETLFASYARDTTTRRLLDLGCGTGNHAIRLAARGYDVLGIDRSEPMLAVARGKADELKASARFELGDLRELYGSRTLAQAAEPADAAVMMFTVLGYLTTETELEQVLTGIHRRLRTGGLLIADHWYGPAVLAGGPTTRVRFIEQDDMTVVRIAEGTIDLARQVYTTTVRLLTLSGNLLVADCEETHNMRFFFPRELHLIFSRSGFEVIATPGFPDISQEPSPSNWWACVVARSTS
ncbi:MAG: class I SAM-dependent DNA methyltransferase [Acidimicrobiales bacterium]